MDFNPPTTADFAYSDALPAHDKIRKLEQRVQFLETRLSALELLVKQFLEAIRSSGGHE